MRPTTALLAVLCFAPAESSAAPEPAGWTWTTREEKLLARYEKQVKEEDGLYRFLEGVWHVETPGSALLAAEIALYVQSLEAAAADLLGARRKERGNPTLKVFPSRAAFREKVPYDLKAFHSFEMAVGDDRGLARSQVVEDHVYTYVETEGAPSFDDLDLAAIRGELARSVLSGLTGQQGTCQWLDEGFASFFREWDLREPPQEAFAGRRSRSPALRSLAEKLAGGGIELPSIEPLLTLDFAGWETPVAPPFTNAEAAESLVDLLLTERKARSLRDAVLEALTKAAAKRVRTIELEKKDVKKLQAFWEKHLTGTLAAVE